MPHGEAEELPEPSDGPPSAAELPLSSAGTGTTSPGMKRTQPVVVVPQGWDVPSVPPGT
jgi:hypothetical protein